MSTKYSDSGIQSLVKEAKELTNDFHKRIKPKNRTGHKESQLEIIGKNGNQFRLIIRLSNTDPLNFSIILALIPQDIRQLFRLRRLNGKHQHTNIIEKNTFYDFHIHQAIERYQELESKEDWYAEPTTIYTDINSAYGCVFNECNLILPSNYQLPLFGAFLL